MSLKDPREFAIAQTMMTIMHQHQTKEEIIKHLTTTAATGNSGVASIASGPDDEGSRLQRGETKAGAKTEPPSRPTVDSLKHPMQHSKGGKQKPASQTGCRSPRARSERGASFFLSPVQIASAERYLKSITGKHDLINMKAEDLRDGRFSITSYENLGVGVDTIFKKAVKYSDPGVPPAVVFLLSTLARNMICNNIGQFMDMSAISRAYGQIKNTDLCVECVVANSIRRSHYYCKGDCGLDCFRCTN